MTCLVKVKNYAISLCLLTGIVSTVDASPKIENVSGEASEGSTITILGSEFSRVDNKKTLYDQVDNQTIYDNLAHGTPVPLNQGLWTTRASKWGNPIEIVRSGDLRTDGASAAYFGLRKAELGYPSILSDSQTRELYVSWWFKPSKAVDQGGSNKFIRIWDRNDGEGTRISWTQMHMTHTSPSPSWNQTQPTPEKWNRFEIHVDSDSNTITARLNGKVKHSETNFVKAPNSEGLDIRLIGFDPSESTPYSDYSFRMKDIYFSETQARVEVSASPTWDLESHREVLQPLNWSDSSIEVVLEKFSFDQFDNLYVYVIDQEGNVNDQGYPLCGDCPSSPTVITID
jgi:hypothetical protein